MTGARQDRGGRPGAGVRKGSASRQRGGAGRVPGLALLALALAWPSLAQAEQVVFLPEEVDLLAAVWHPDGRCVEVGLTRRREGRGVTLDVPPGAAWGGIPLVRLTPAVVAELRRAGATALGLIDPAPGQLALLETFPELEVLHLRNTRRLQDADLTPLTALPRLRQLQLDNARHLTLAGLATLAKVPALTFLGLREATGLEGAPLTRFAGGALHTVDLSLCPGVTSLAGGAELPLRALNLDGCLGLGTKGLRALAGLEQLERLSLRGCMVDDAALQALPAGLRELDLGDTGASAPGLVALLARLEALEILRLPACAALDARLAPALAGLPALRELDLREAAWLGAAELAHLARLPALARLDLGGASVRGADLAKLADATALRDLGLTDCRGLGPAAGPALARLQGLRRLALGGTALDDDALAHLARLPALEDLDLSRAGRVSDGGLQALVELPLVRLDLSLCAQLGVASVEPLSKLTRLRHLDLVGSGVPIADVERLQAALPDCVIRSLE